MKLPKLTPPQLQLLDECCRYSIYNDWRNKEFVRLGGHGYVPMRYNSDALHKLKKLGLLEFGNPCKANTNGVDICRALLAARTGKANP